jgi:phosphoribosylaminoimidazolecarboxamide formyltransferase/IMP cyclohydrolase
MMLLHILFQDAIRIARRYQKRNRISARCDNMADKPKDPLATKNVGVHPGIIRIECTGGTPCSESLHYKAMDLRYGTNPTQTAALYGGSFLGKLRECRTGKEGPSQTNMEDIFYAALMAGYFDAPSFAIMKHENPSGFATQYEPEPLALTYRKARDADFRAAFGGTAFTNTPVDKDTAEAVRELFTEVLVAPGYDEGVVEKFKGSIRIFEYPAEALRAIPRFVGDVSEPELKRLADGSVIRSDVLLTPIRNADELRQYIASARKPTDGELRDLLTGYRIRLRSNSVRMVKNGYTTG